MSSTLAAQVPLSPPIGRRQSGLPLLLYPQLSGWGARAGLVVWLVVDRIINAQRVSEEVIQDIGALDSYALFQIGMTFGLSFYLLRVSLSKSARFAVQVMLSTPLLWIAIYIALAIVSAAWSGAILLTAFKAIQCLVFFFCAILALVGLRNIRQRISYIAVAGLYYLATSYITYAMFTVPELGLNIVSLHFVVGAVPFVGVLYLVRIAGIDYLRRTFSRLFLPFVVIETILTVYIALLAAQAARYYLGVKSATKYVGLLAPVFGAAAVLVIVPDDPNASILGIKKVGEVTSGTGRFDVWNFVLTESFPKAPVLGHGFVTGDTVAREAHFTAALGQLHNSFLSALSNLGLIGLSLWLLFLFGSYRLMLKHPRLDVRLAFVGSAIVCLFQQLAGGASLSSPMHSVWVSHALFFSLVAIESVDVRAAKLGRFVRW